MRQSELGISIVKESYPVFQTEEKTFDYKEWLSDCINQSKAEIFIMDMRDELTRQELMQIKKKVQN